MQRSSLFSLLFFAICLVGPVSDARASIVQAVDLAQLTQEADQIVLGDVLSVTSNWDREHRNIYTTVEVGVQETWKGATPADGKLVVRHLGGSVGEIEMAVLGEASFTTGERAVLFLREARTVSMAQGKRLVRWEPSAKRWLAAAPESRGATVIPSKTSGKVVDGNGGEEPLESLRAKVRALLGK